MPGRTKVNEKHRIIEVQFSGKVSSTDIAKSATQALHKLSIKSFSKILVDTSNQENTPSTFDIFSHFCDFPHEFKLALLARRSEEIIQEHFFLETAGENRFFRMKLSHDKSHALQWLGNC